MWNPSVDTDKTHHVVRDISHVAADFVHLLQGSSQGEGVGTGMSYEAIAIIMFGSMLLMLLTGQRVCLRPLALFPRFAALLLWGDGGVEMPFTAAFKLFKWYPLLTLPLFIYMGYILSESGIASDLYRMFHVWFGGLKGGTCRGNNRADGG